MAARISGALLRGDEDIVNEIDVGSLGDVVCEHCRAMR